MNFDDNFNFNRGQNKKPSRGARNGLNKETQCQENRKNQSSSGFGGILKDRLASNNMNGAGKRDSYDGHKGRTFKISDTTILISNLYHEVYDPEIRELFREFGPLKKAVVYYNRRGRSLGIAEVEFENRADALEAIEYYNGIPLDGRPMSVQFLKDVVSMLRPKHIGNGGSKRKNRKSQFGGRNRKGGTGTGGKGQGNSSQKRNRGTGATVGGGLNNNKEDPETEIIMTALGKFRISN